MKGDPLALVRQEIMAQPAQERLGYALEILAFYLSPTPAFFDGCRALGINLCVADLRLLYALDRRRGFCVSEDALMAAWRADRDVEQWPDDAHLSRAVSRVRKGLEAAGLSAVSITNWQGLGYYMTAPAGFSFEAALAVPDLSAHRAEGLRA